MRESENESSVTAAETEDAEVGAAEAEEEEEEEEKKEGGAERKEKESQIWVWLMKKKRMMKNAALRLSLFLIQQPLTHTVFDSSMIFFTAALVWNFQQDIWQFINIISFYLAQLIYCCQVFIFQNCV